MGITFTGCCHPSPMGQLLSEPDLRKTTSKVVTSKFTVGVSCMQGWRAKMEDAHTVLPMIPGDIPPVGSFFGVFDGHGGHLVADYASQALHRYISNSKEYHNGKIKTAIEFAFLDLDEDMGRIKKIVQEMSGSTAITVLIKNNMLYCANVGDSRAIGWLDGSVISLSEDHKPTLPKEMARIKAAGGYVEAERVNGSLALSRALGDFQFKMDPNKPHCKQIVTACPDIISKELNNKWKFLVIACDGIWEVLSNDEVGHFVNYSLNNGIDPEMICEMLMDKCVAPTNNNCGPGCDNMTVIIVVFHWDKGDGY